MATSYLALNLFCDTVLTISATYQTEVYYDNNNLEYLSVDLHATAYPRTPQQFVLCCIYTSHNQHNITTRKLNKTS